MISIYFYMLIIHTYIYMNDKNDKICYVYNLIYIYNIILGGPAET